MTNKIELISGFTTSFVLSREIKADNIEEGFWLSPALDGRMDFPAVAGEHAYMAISDTDQPSTKITNALVFLMEQGYVKTTQIDSSVTPVSGMKLAAGTAGKLIEFVSGTHDYYVAIVDHADGDYTYIKIV